MQWYEVGPHGESDEYEGIDIYDTDADPRFGAYTLGQIHLMQTESGPLDGCCYGSDEYWLSHFRVNDPSHL